MKILTTNWHESYLYLLAKTGYEFEYISPLLPDNTLRKWDQRTRPIPLNMKEVSLPLAKYRLKIGYYNLVILHNIKDIPLINETETPVILIFHTMLNTSLMFGGEKICKENITSIRQNLKSLNKRVKFVFVSPRKKESWDLEGEIVLPGIDPDEYKGYIGEVPCAITVANYFKERRIGYSDFFELVEGIKYKIIGTNPTISESRPAESWQELKNEYIYNRLYVNTTPEEHEDGYNLAMLEAMATGMPVVSLANISSPIQDEYNGIISSDKRYLKEKIKQLLKDINYAKKLGNKARETVINKFHIDQFVENWRSIIEKYASNKKLKRIAEKPPQTPSLKILFYYVAHPCTTAFYIERALRKIADVKTCGPSIDERIIESWNLKDIKGKIYYHDIPVDYTTSISEIINLIKEDWIPDLFLWVETGLGTIPSGLEELSIPKVCYLIDNHLNLEYHLNIAQYFDYVFIAQKEYLEDFKLAGIKNVWWLPLGCDPEFHSSLPLKPVYDVVFVGSITEKHVRRREYLEALSSKFNVKIERTFLEKMQELMSKGKIIFNCSVRGDVNMRVYEALCSGRLLITDYAVGIEDLFQDKEELIIYRSKDELIQKVEYYLKNPEEREKIAKKGQQKVQKYHTYFHRVQNMLEIIKKNSPLKSSLLIPPKLFSSHEILLNYIPKEIKNALIICSGAGHLAQALRYQTNISKIVCIENEPLFCRLTSRYTKDIINKDFDSINLIELKEKFELIVCLGYLHYSPSPERLLRKLRRIASSKAIVILSFSNIRYYRNIYNLLKGNIYSSNLLYNYKNLFSYKDIKNLFRKIGGFSLVETYSLKDPLYNQYNNLSNIESIKIGDIILGGLAKEDVLDMFIKEYYLVLQRL